MKPSLTNRLLTSLVLLYCVNASALDLTELDQTYLLFPFTHAEIRPNVHHEQDLETFEVEFGADFFYLLNYKKYRLLAELAITNEEFELERLQFGLDLTQNNTLWAGRFHSPLGYWNSNYHHGLHLQTSVHRPGIIEYEEKGGVLVNHVTGLMLDGQHFGQSGVFNYSAAIGYAPTLGHTLEPYTLGSSDNKLHNIFKIGYQPDETNPSESGLVFSQSSIVGEDEHVNQIEQKILGVFSHQSWEKSRITASAYLIENRIEYSTALKTTAKFAAGYLHAEYDIATKWIIYARFERTIGGEHDPYLELFEHSETQRNLGGIRYDLSRRQAISSEVSHRIAEHDSHTHISIQWSAVFP